VWLSDPAGPRPTDPASGTNDTVHSLRFVLVALAGWVNQRQRDVIDYLQEENRRGPSFIGSLVGVGCTEIIDFRPVL
jgi:hypothetical protein